MKGLVAAVVMFVAFLALLAVVSAFAGLLLWPLWNWLMPAVFGLPEISWLEAVGLYFLAGFLTRSSSASSGASS